MTKRKPKKPVGQWITQEELARIKSTWYDRGHQHGMELLREKFKDLFQIIDPNDLTGPL